MKEKFIHTFRQYLKPLTGKQIALRKRIITDISGVEPVEYDNFVQERGRREFAKLYSDKLKQLLDSEKRYKILEVGMGTGLITKELNKIPNLDVVGLDVNEKFIEYAIKHKRVKKEQTVIGDFNCLPFEDSLFDLATAVAILQYRQDIDKYYKEMLRVLKKDGLLFLPWVKPRKISIDKEVENLQRHSIDIIERGDWFLLGKNTKTE